MHYSTFCLPQKVTNTCQPLFLFFQIQADAHSQYQTPLTLLFPETLQAHVCTCFPACSLCPLLCPCCSSHTHRHTQTQTVAFWLAALAAAHRPRLALVSACMLALLPCLRPPSSGSRYFCGWWFNLSAVCFWFFFFWLVFQHFRPAFSFCMTSCAFSSVHVGITEFL